MRALLLSRDQAGANDLIGPEPLLLSEIVGTKFTKRSVQHSQGVERIDGVATKTFVKFQCLLSCLCFGKYVMLKISTLA